MKRIQLSKSESVDPQDWDDMRALGHNMLDDMFEYLATLRQRPVWQPMPEAVSERFERPLPRQGKPLQETYADFREYVLNYSMGNVHPRFWGWVMGNGTPLGMLADMLASGLNPNLGGGEHAPSQVELQVVEWCRQMFDFPAGASGLLLSGGSVANLIGLAVARTARAGFDVRRHGVRASDQPMTLYGSAEMHSSLQKAVELLGLGDEYLRRIPVDESYRIRVDALRQQLDADVEAGMLPICLIGCAGTVNTGAIDPLNALADIAQEYDLWYHIDGAFGSLAYLSPELRHRLQGMSRADSLAFDLHKWFYLPFEIGCTLVADEETHRHTFSLTPDYLQHSHRGLAGGSRWLSDYGIQLTRGFRALKAWMAFETYGVDKIARLILQNVQQAEYLAQGIEASPHLELVAPVALNVVCFRFHDPGLDDGDLNRLNEEILYRLHETGAAVPSSTTLDGVYALRCAITNYRSQTEDFDFLLEEVIRLGRQIQEER